MEWSSSTHEIHDRRSASSRSHMEMRSLGWSLLIDCLGIFRSRRIPRNEDFFSSWIILRHLERDIPFNDADMNRIWEGEGIGYEYVRREVIKPYLFQCDHILDIHSTTALSVPMTVSCRIHSLARRVLSDMLVTYQIENIWEFVIGKTLMEFHNDIKPDGVAFAVECGSHRSPTAGDIAYENTLRFLSYFWLISYVFTQEHVPTVLSVIRVYKAPDIWPIEYLYTDQPESFQKIPPHTQVARFQGEDIFSPNEETYILMPTPYARYIGDSVMYFTREILE